jgi:3-deoxy-manno-octulosonate cytidylyltransferase (CMP-KDO synthetase)
LAAIAVIPARFASSRFPGKMIANETGKPLVQHVVDQVRQCSGIKEIIVAADDERIVAALRPFKTRCVMTDPNHPSGTDRVAEVAGRDAGSADVIVNVQGDEPEIEPRTVDDLLDRMNQGGEEMMTAATRFGPTADPSDPNLVKVVISRAGRAMYFSRSRIPFAREAKDRQPTYYLHIGIYAYRRETLLRLAGCKPTPCESAEKLEQLRALENDVRIGVMVVERWSHGIDTPAQYAEFVARFRNRA